MTVTDARKLESLLQEGWDLSELLPEASETVVSSRIADLEVSVRAFENWRTELSPKLSPDRLVELLEDYETLVSKLIVLGFYGSLWFSSDTQSQAALDYRNRIEQVLTGVENRMLFFTLWWKQLDDDAAELLLPAASKHPDFRHYLEDLRRLRK